MTRKIRLSLLFLLLSVFVSAGAMHTYAITIGELLGWETAKETEKTADRDSGKRDAHEAEVHNADDSDADARDKGDNYYETLELDKDGTYDTKDEVCAYLVQYHSLPRNYMTKKEARRMGWEGGPLDRLLPGRSIGGDYFGNYDGILPEVDDREYHECDIDTIGASQRGAKRIIYSGDDDAGEWNIYYTEDHYESFTLLWGEDDYGNDRAQTDQAGSGKTQR